MKNDPSLTNSGANESEILTPSELMRKHLTDPNHQVTDEELRNVKVGVEAEDEDIVSKESDAAEEEIESLSNSENLPNPYRVLE